MHKFSYPLKRYYNNKGRRMKKPFKFCEETIFPEKVTGFKIKPQKQDNEFNVSSYLNVTFLFDGDSSLTVKYKFENKVIENLIESLKELKSLIDDRKKAQQSLDEREKEIEYAKNYANYIQDTISQISDYNSQIIESSKKYEKEIAEWHKNKRKTNIPSYQSSPISEYDIKKNIKTFEQFKFDAERDEFRWRSTCRRYDDILVGKFENHWHNFATKSEKKKVENIWKNINTSLSSECSNIENILLKELAGCTLSEITVYTDES